MHAICSRPKGPQACWQKHPKFTVPNTFLTRRAVDQATGDKLISHIKWGGGLYDPKQGLDGQQPLSWEQAGWPYHDP